MTDHSDPREPKPARNKPQREPATLDLKATVIDDGRESAAREEVRAEEAVGSSEATLDSGSGTDAIGPESAPQATKEAASEAAPEEPVRPKGAVPPQPAPRSPVGALMGAGLLGGLVGAGLVYGIQLWQGAEEPQDPRVAQLSQQVAALSQQRPPAIDAQALENRLRALETARGALDQRLQGLQAAAERAASRAEEAANRPLPSPPPQNNAALTDLANRLTALENQGRANAQSASAAASAAQGLDRRVAEQEQRLAALSRQVAEEGRGAESAAQAGVKVVLAGRLGDALRTGAPYAEILEGLRRTGADGARLSALEPFARQGAPTGAMLEQGFRPVAAAILRETRDTGSGDWSDRLRRMFDRVVTVRAVNDDGSGSVQSLVARIEQALGRGDVAAAAAAWDALPEPARRLSEEWGRQVKARTQADEAAQALLADALTALNRT